MGVVNSKNKITHPNLKLIPYRSPAFSALVKAMFRSVCTVAPPVAPPVAINKGFVIGQLTAFVRPGGLQIG